MGRALSIMHENPALRTVASLATEIGVSRATLARRFHDIVGEPPMSFLTHWRLALAADLLSEPDASVGSVAEKMGYSSPFALSAAFKRVRGISPQEHRLGAKVVGRRASYVPPKARVPSQALCSILTRHECARQKKHLSIHRLGTGKATVSELAEPHDMALPSFMKHLKVLEESGLIRTRKTGRVKKLTAAERGLPNNVPYGKAVRTGLPNMWRPWPPRRNRNDHE